MAVDNRKPGKLPARDWLRWLPWLLAALALAWALYVAPLAQILAVLWQLTWLQLALLVGINAVIVVALAGRWWVVLRALGYSLPYLRLVAYRLAAYSITYFTPGPQFGGEPLQAYLPRQQHGVPGVTSGAAVALDKAVELLANFTVLALGVAAIFNLRLLSADSLAALLALTVVLLMLPILYLGAARMGLRPATLLLGRVPILAKSARLQPSLCIVQRAEYQVCALCQQRPGSLAIAFAISLLTWALMIGEYWLAARFLGMTLSPEQALAAIAAARLAYLLPFPGGLGALEASQVFVFGAMGYDPAAGAALALLIRARDVLLALIGLWLASWYAPGRSGTKV
ncbi:MAG: flippase-like domain-containing protein [Caldilineales bacterium]|nr:flippase-like domain-containing protein [Caldilineales bacterium]